MGYYAKNKYEEPEDPRCPDCDDFLVAVDTWTFGLGKVWECHNPECAECAPKYKKEMSDENDE